MQNPGAPTWTVRPGRWRGAERQRPAKGGGTGGIRAGDKRWAGEKEGAVDASVLAGMHSHNGIDASPSGHTLARQLIIAATWKWLKACRCSLHTRCRSGVREQLVMRRVSPRASSRPGEEAEERWGWRRGLSRCAPAAPRLCHASGSAPCGALCEEAPFVRESGREEEEEDETPMELSRR